MLLSSFVTGCRHFEVAHHADMVYVTAQQTFLRDRVAAVSNKVAMVYNGEQLEVVERGRRFIKVKTPQGAIGWLEEHMVIDQATYDKFKKLHDDNLATKAVSTGILRDDLYAHLTPGRESQKFLLLPENDKLQLLVRASTPKADAQASWLHPAVKPGQAQNTVTVKSLPTPAPATSGKGRLHGRKGEKSVDPNAVPMEDWWLVRDSAGRVGWVLARRLDVDIPEEVVQYAEGQRIVGAYLLNKVSDPESKFPDGEAPNYVAVLSPYKDGLPYDYDQIRVFAWNTKKHRYEGAYRKRDVAGYLPVSVSQQAVETSGPLAGIKVPVFTVRVAKEDAEPSLDPATGLIRPVPTDEQSFSLEGEMVKRLLPAGETPPPPPVRKDRPTAPRHASVHRHRRHR